MGWKWLIVCQSTCWVNAFLGQAEPAVAMMSVALTVGRDGLSAGIGKEVRKVGGRVFVRVFCCLGPGNEPLEFVLS